MQSGISGLVQQTFSVFPCGRAKTGRRNGLFLTFIHSAVMFLWFCHLRDKFNGWTITTATSQGGLLNGFQRGFFSSHYMITCSAQWGASVSVCWWASHLSPCWSSSHMWHPYGRDPWWNKDTSRESSAYSIWTWLQSLKYLVLITESQDFHWLSLSFQGIMW